MIVINYLFIVPIELRKVSKVSKDNKENSSLKAWLEFINNPEEKPKMGDKEELIKAREILEDMSRTKRERYLAEQREKWIMDKHAIHAAGFDKGKKEGRKEGIEEGKHQKEIEIAINLKKQKHSIESIMQATGLSKKQVEEL